MINLNKKIKNLIEEEDGSSMLEFALVLPILISLTVGSLYLSVSFSQKAVMNGVNFMAARAASVRINPKETAEKNSKRYVVKLKNQKWMGDLAPPVVKEIKLGIPAIQIEMSKDAMNTDILANSLSVLSGHKPNHKINKITSGMILPREFVKFRDDGARPITSKTVDYKTKPVFADFLKRLLEGLPGDTEDAIVKSLFPDLVDEKTDNADHGRTNDTMIADRVIGANPKYNMKKVNKAYDYWGITVNEEFGIGGDSEIPIGTPVDPNNLNFLRLTGTNIKAIETGQVALSVVKAALSVSAGPLINNAALAPIKKALEKVEQLGTKMSTIIENNNNRLFKKESDL